MNLTLAPEDIVVLCEALEALEGGTAQADSSWRHRIIERLLQRLRLIGDTSANNG